MLGHLWQTKWQHCYLPSHKHMAFLVTRTLQRSLVKLVQQIFLNSAEPMLSHMSSEVKTKSQAGKDMWQQKQSIRFRGRQIMTGRVKKGSETRGKERQRNECFSPAFRTCCASQVSLHFGTVKTMSTSQEWTIVHFCFEPWSRLQIWLSWYSACLAHKSPGFDPTTT